MIHCPQTSSTRLKICLLFRPSATYSPHLLQMLPLPLPRRRICYSVGVFPSDLPQSWLQKMEVAFAPWRSLRLRTGSYNGGGGTRPRALSSVEETATDDFSTFSQKEAIILGMGVPKRFFKIYLQAIRRSRKPSVEWAVNSRGIWTISLRITTWMRENTAEGVVPLRPRMWVFKKVEGEFVEVWLLICRVITFDNFFFCGRTRN